MRIEQLHYLIEVSKNPSLNIASEKLHISHQSLNKSLKNLEEELGTELLIRSSSGVSLTTNGKRTVQAAKNILRELDELNSYIKQHNQQNNKENMLLSGALSIGSTPATSSSIIPSLIADFKVRMPSIRLFVSDILPDEVYKSVTSHALDLAIVNYNSSEMSSIDTATINYQILFSERVYALIHKNSSLSHNKYISLKRFSKEPLILFGNKTADNLSFDFLSAYTSSMKKYDYTTSRSFYFEALSNGFPSITIPSIYNSFDDSLKSQLHIVPLKEKIMTHIVMIYDPSLQKNEAFNVFKNFLLSSFNNGEFTI